ncbi:hypothetical protein EGT36_27835 [Agrobacterium sp. FDAARGOS_525]|uniref:DUF6985 domain-containing protein n=1 Tax=Agrobacterium sp. FDAARGOS_525 TaxID=2420311 RepID=UPI000F682614|nr:hypothetical protein [Agrobacterium sp. FDAARGOS_525]RSC30055.1 hypothetical protein EGT36_27835 [Agrobacterium sp. FDAARGOS_525]
MTTIVVSYFDGAEVELDEEPDPDAPAAAAALGAFLALTKADRLSDTRHVFAFYRDYYEEAGRPEWLEEEIGFPQSPADIWDHVTPGPVTVEKGRRDDENWYVVMQAECGWDAERGLMMVWRGGATLTKVGGYNGHLTNVNVYADRTLENVVYKARNPEYTTRLSRQPD